MRHESPKENEVWLRVAHPEDADAIARLVNQAFQVERFFIEGDRTNPGAVRELLGKGKFLVAEQAGALAGCVYLEPRGDRCYLRRPASPFPAVPAACNEDSAGAPSSGVVGISPRARGGCDSYGSGAPAAGDSAIAAVGSSAGGAPGRGSGMPSRVSASSAFFFQSARRKRCAAIVYQFPASSICSAFSSIAPNSHATIASRVRW